MSYRKIFIDGRAYRYKVGRRFVEIRNADDGENFKKILPKPAPKKRWGVLFKNADSGAMQINIYFNPINTNIRFNQLKETHPFKDTIELITLPDKIVAITPGWIAANI